jgi:hypothetical protein
MSSKICNICNIPKELENFSKHKYSKDGHENKCKSCRSEYSKERNKNKPLDKEQLKTRNKEYYQQNKEKVKSLTKNYRSNNSDKIQEYQKQNKESRIKYSKQHYQKNKDYIREFHKKWNSENKEWYKTWEKNQYLNNPQYRLKKQIRCRIWYAIKAQNAHKSNKTLILLGCNISEFKLYLESLFLPEMSWSNHGTVWEIDHIKPCSSFNLTDPKEQAKCFHYTNMQPLFKTTLIAEDLGYVNYIGNREKGNRTYNVK